MAYFMSDIHDFDDNQIFWKFAEMVLCPSIPLQKFFLAPGIPHDSVLWTTFFGWPHIFMDREGKLKKLLWVIRILHQFEKSFECRYASLLHFVRHLQTETSSSLQQRIMVKPVVGTYVLGHSHICSVIRSHRSLVRTLTLSIAPELEGKWSS